MAQFKGPLHQMAQTTVTQLWNDSCSVQELSYSIESGAVGATTNPVIVGNVLKKELPAWEGRIKEIITTNPRASEDDVAWKIIEEMGLKAAELLMPIFTANKGLKGRLSMQTNPKYWRDTQKMIDQTIYFSKIAPNIQVKMPTTKASLAAYEEVTFQGVCINATVCFTVAQAVAVAEAVERGLARRKKAGLDCSQMNPVCTIMVGRVDDWLKKVAEKQGVITDPGYLEWAGVAVMKNAYRIYQERGYTTKLLAAAYRNHLQWSEFIGGDVVLTIPYEWQVKFNGSDVESKDRINNPVKPEIIAELRKKFPDFVKAYDENGLNPDEFDSYGATRRTLLQFLAAYDDVVKIIRGIMISDPDIKGK